MNIRTSLFDLLSGILTQTAEKKAQSRDYMTSAQIQKGNDLAFLKTFITSRKNIIRQLDDKLKDIRKEINGMEETKLQHRIEYSRCVHRADEKLIEEQIESDDVMLADLRSMYMQVHAKSRQLEAFVLKAEMIQVKIAASHDSSDIRELVVLASEVADDDWEKAVLLQILKETCNGGRRI